jgi:hypothetical protein
MNWVALGPGYLLRLRISPCAFEYRRLARRQVLIAVDREVKMFSFMGERRQTKLIRNRIFSAVLISIF